MEEDGRNQAGATDAHPEAAAAGKTGDDPLAAADKEPELEEHLSDGEEADDDYEEEDDQEGLPSFEFRFETAKLLIELDDDTDAALQACPLPLLCCNLHQWSSRCCNTEHVHFPYFVNLTESG